MFNQIKSTCFNNRFLRAPYLPYEFIHFRLNCVFMQSLINAIQYIILFSLQNNDTLSAIFLKIRAFDYFPLPHQKSLKEEEVIHRKWIDVISVVCHKIKEIGFKYSLIHWNSGEVQIGPPVPRIQPTSIGPVAIYLFMHLYVLILPNRLSPVGSIIAFGICGGGPHAVVKIFD
jgi:hypothetical protein